MPTRRQAPNSVAVRPPVPLMQPRPVPVLPAEDGMPGGVVYEIKVDGVRCCAARTEAGVELWSRRARPLHERFPEVLPALAELLAPGVVLDGELCPYRGGRLAFPELLRSPRARAADGVAVSYVVWDVLAVPGRDVRGLPLVERRDLLAEVLVGARPPVEQVMSTRSRVTALGWYLVTSARQLWRLCVMPPRVGTIRAGGTEPAKWCTPGDTEPANRCTPTDLPLC
ncbi:hypothetical protein ACFVUY_37905 [Kitasatospora sp. NPDC058063]|uniref:ATP-dependent DNA ligase n=1 Tax=unclassified Kitasatospora TaxID=2633591 RepID=UPI0036D8827B